MADVKFPGEQCEMDKFEVACPTNQSCIDFYKEEEPGGETLTFQGFGTKTLCKDSVKYYANKERNKDDGTTLCLINCCVMTLTNNATAAEMELALFFPS